MSAQAIRNVIIVGSGPAGYTAATYAARAKLNPLVLAGERFGGQLMLTTEVENYPGFSQGIMGPKLMMEMKQQAERFGAEILFNTVTKIELKKSPFSVWVGETRYQSKAVIISTGAESLTLGLPREEILIGRGVSTCAVCDAAFYSEKTVYVVGGGDSAMEDTLALTKFAKAIHVVVRRDQFRASKIMQERVLNHPNVKVLWSTEVSELLGNEALTGLKLRDLKTGSETEVAADGLFFAIGHKPTSDFLNHQLQLDPVGYILTPLNGLPVSQPLHDLWKHQYPTATSIEGVFAAGDVVDFRYRQAITAAGMGCMAALDVERWLQG